MLRKQLMILMLVAGVWSLSASAQRPGGGGSGGGKPGGGRPGPTPRSTPSTAPRPNRTPSAMGSPSSADLPSAPITQHADQESKVEFRTETVLVQVPVVVTDKSGNHIHSLTKDSFRVFENGKEQKVAAFEEIVANTSRVLSNPPQPGEFSNISLASRQPRSVTVVALDTVNTPFLDQAYARKALVKYLANNVDSSQTLGLVIISSKGLRVVQGLTSDPTALLQILKKLSGDLPEMHNLDTDVEAAAAAGDGSGLLMASNPITTQSTLSDFISQGDVLYAQFKQENAIETTMRAFLGIAWSLSGIPGRKSLIWATGAFPFYLDSPSTVPGGRLSVLYERAMQVLNDAEISVYPVDVRGLVNYSPAADVTARRAASGPAAMQQLMSRSWLQNAKIDTLRDFAEMTGGRAFYNTNDLAGSFKRAADDSSSYYMLGYYLDTKNDMPGWRQLKVKVDQKNTEARARNGFLVTNTTMNPELTRIADIGFALTSPFGATGIPVVMRWQEAKPEEMKKLDAKNGEKKDPNKKAVGFALHMPGEALTVEGTRNQLDVDFVALATAAAAKDGTAADEIKQTLKGSLSAENVAKLRGHGMSYSNVFELAPGKYQVRFVVRDNLNGRIGSLSAPLTVN